MSIDKDWSQVRPEKQRMVNIKGTSGSGKTTIMFKLFAKYANKVNYFVPGRRQPIAHVFWNEGKRPLAVIGHYNAGSAGCGGLDSISHYALMCEVIKYFWDKGYHVASEGLLATGDQKQTIKLNTLADGKLRVLALNTDMQTCINAVNARRRDKDPNASDVNPDNLLSKANSVPGVMEKLAEAGVQAKWVDRNEGWEWVAKIFSHTTDSVWQVGEAEPKWNMGKEVNVQFKTLDERGERVMGLYYNGDTKSIEFDQQLYDKEKAAQDAREARKAGLGGGTSDPKAPKVKVSTYRNMLQPADDAHPLYRKFYRSWRQLRRQERKARKAAEKAGQAWPPTTGDYSSAWHEQQAAKWQEEYNKLQTLVDGLKPLEPTQDPVVLPAQNQYPGLDPAESSAVTGAGSNVVRNTGSSSDYKAGHLQIIEQEVQYLSGALAQALARLQAARNGGQ